MGLGSGALEDLGLNVLNPKAEFWLGKRVLLTGHTGFKGSWLAFWLGQLGAQVTGVALPPLTQPNLFSLARLESLTTSHELDIRETVALASVVEQADPEILFHLAAQPLVRASYRDPVGTFSTNVQGTVNLLDALRPSKAIRVVVAVTTDKVYQNLEHPFPYRESDALGGHDPYSASKAAAELAIACYRDAFLRAKGVAVASARAGNVIGGGDWSEDRLIPDAVRAWSAGQSLDIRCPEAIRPWQHVLEPLASYLLLAERLWVDPQLAGAYNFGPLTHEAATVRDVIECARAAFPNAVVQYGGNDQGPHEAAWLALEVAKARTVLGIKPRWCLQQTVNRTMAWYGAQEAGADPRTLCAADIQAFIEST